MYYASDIVLSFPLELIHLILPTILQVRSAISLSLQMRTLSEVQGGYWFKITLRISSKVRI